MPEIKHKYNRSKTGFLEIIIPSKLLFMKFLKSHYYLSEYSRIDCKHLSAVSPSHNSGLTGCLCNLNAL